MNKLLIIPLLIIFVYGDGIYKTEGSATHYGYGFHNKRSGAGGLKVDAYMPIAASRDIPYGSIVEIENIDDTSRCKGNRIRVMIFDWGPGHHDRTRIIDLMPEGGYFSYNGKPGIAEKGRGGVKVRVKVINTTEACNSERLGSERQAKNEYFCLRNKQHFGTHLDKEEIFWKPYYLKNKYCYEKI